MSGSSNLKKGSKAFFNPTHFCRPDTPDKLYYLTWWKHIVGLHVGV